MKYKILGTSFHVVTLNEAVKRIVSFLEKDKKSIVVTPNPEIVMQVKKDESLKKIINSADLSVADGIGIVLASKLLKGKIKERVAGYDLLQALFLKLKETDKTFYFLGGEQDVAENAAKKMRKKHKGLNVLGHHSGFFDASEEMTLLNEINTLSPDILLVGLGAPKQEKWIYANMDKINAKVFIGVGGSFDVMSGRARRAPIFFQKLGLEWLYRLFKEPKRIKRMIQLPLFLLEVIVIGKQNQ